MQLTVIVIAICINASFSQLVDAPVMFSPIMLQLNLKVVEKSNRWLCGARKTNVTKKHRLFTIFFISESFNLT